MKEEEIRDLQVFRRYLELSRRDAERMFSDRSDFETINCPACDSNESTAEFDKNGFTYARCPRCETLFVNPRPKLAALHQFYLESESTAFWVDEFFAPKAEKRRELIFRPRADAVADRFPGLGEARIGEVGAGFGIFLEELRKLWPRCHCIAIEPSRKMAQICADKGLDVIETMFEDLTPTGDDFDLLTAFELAEHLQNAFEFFSKARRSLRPGGVLLFTTLSGFGLDVQLLGRDSKSVSPPHHLNFFNPGSVKLLLERCGFTKVEVSTPGRLDWSIIENSIKEGINPGSFWVRFANHADASAKETLQAWLSRHGWSSHMQVIAS